MKPYRPGLNVAEPCSASLAFTLYDVTYSLMNALDPFIDPDLS